MRLITILISAHFMIASLMSNNEFAGLMRMDQLIQHFHHHIEEHHEKINFIEFLVMHYLDQDHLQKDKQEHESLPLHQHGAHCTSISFIPPSHQGYMSMQNMVMYEPVSFHSFYIEHFFSKPLIDIWQPPKLG